MGFGGDRGVFLVSNSVDRPPSQREPGESK